MLVPMALIQLLVAAYTSGAWGASGPVLDGIEKSHSPSQNSSSENKNDNDDDELSGLLGSLLPSLSIVFGGCPRDPWLRADRGVVPDSLLPCVKEKEEPIIKENGEYEEDDESISEETEVVARRYGELQGSAFLGMTEGIYGFDVSARGYLSLLALDVSWLRLYEPDSPTLNRLDLLRASLALAIIPAKYVEVHALAGPDVLHGKDWTPAVGLGLDVRTYPIPKLTVAGMARVSVFGEGYPLLDSRLEVGAAVGRVDFRAGMRWIFQQYDKTSTSILGPSVSVLIRLGR